MNFWPASNIMKTKQGKNCNKFKKVFIRIPGTYKKHLDHIELSRSYIWFRVNITRVFLHRGNNVKYFVPKAVLQQEDLLTGFEDQPHKLLSLPVIFSEQTEFTDKITSGFTNITNFKMQN